MSTQFQYKDYVFSINPNRFEIFRGRILKTFQPPIVSKGTTPRAMIQPIGLEPIVIKGEGELVGVNPMEEYAKLYQLFLDEKSGLLGLPNLTPFYCYFESLQLTGQAGPNVLTYQFTFLEDCEKNKIPFTSTKSFYISRAGDTLCLIAVKNNTTTEQLLLSNPTLQVSEELEEGTVVWL